MSRERSLKVPFFHLNEKTGRYKARQNLSDAQIIKAAKKILANKVNRTHIFTDREIVRDYLITHFSEEKSELFIVLFCDTQNRLIKSEILFTGTIDSAVIYPRIVAQRAIALNAASVIFAHNHPSGLDEPSDADKAITWKLKTALKHLDIRTLDHFIIAGGSSFSFARKGIL
jgi:DNA repair protein RadC